MNEHCVVEGTFAVCKNCGGKEEIPLPMSIADFVIWTDSFIKRHGKCKNVAQTTSDKKTSNETS